MTLTRHDEEMAMAIAYAFADLQGGVNSWQMSTLLVGAIVEKLGNRQQGVLTRAREIAGNIAPHLADEFWTACARLAWTSEYHDQASELLVCKVAVRDLTPRASSVPGELVAPARQAIIRALDHYGFKACLIVPDRLVSWDGFMGASLVDLAQAMSGVCRSMVDADSREEVDEICAAWSWTVSTLPPLSSADSYAALLIPCHRSIDEPLPSASARDDLNRSLTLALAKFLPHWMPQVESCALPAEMQ